MSEEKRFKKAMDKMMNDKHLWEIMMWMEARDRAIAKEMKE